LSVTFYFDADCGMCTKLAQWAERNTAATLRAIQQSEPELITLGVPPDRLLTTAHANAHGTLVSGAQAIASVLTQARHPSARGLGRLMALPPMRPAAEAAYRLAAQNRGRISRWLHRTS
jgi:predicted DCC family thiol-disulfide oxidoreductase YuxK